MKKYKVTLYYHTWIDVEVDAPNEEKASLLAYVEAGNDKYNRLLLKHLTATDYYETEEVDE